MRGRIEKKWCEGGEHPLVGDRNHPEKAVYVGDTDGDYRSTMEAGLPFIHAAYGYGTVPEGTPKIDDISELPEIVRQVLA